MDTDARTTPQTTIPISLRVRNLGGPTCIEAADAIDALQVRCDRLIANLESRGDVTAERDEAMSRHNILAEALCEVYGATGITFEPEKNPIMRWHAGKRYGGFAEALVAQVAKRAGKFVDALTSD
jgi:hypothetical protein